MEPPCTHEPLHIQRLFTAVAAHVLIVTHAQTHTYTPEVSGVPVGPVGGWGDFFFFPSS